MSKIKSTWNRKELAVSAFSFPEIHMAILASPMFAEDYGQPLIKGKSLQSHAGSQWSRTEENLTL